jgi:Protein of unknown function (DUF3631)
MNLPPPRVCRRIRQLHAMLGSSNPNEATNARKKLLELLATYSLTWNDVPAILAETDPPSATASRSSPAGPTEAPEVNVLDLVLRLLELHVAVTGEQRLAVALWLLHTHVYDRFIITPRLALLSPVRGCGKTTLLVLLELLAPQPYRVDHTTPAAIYNLLSGRPHTLLIDEGDNLGLATNNVLRTVFNSGHRRGGTISRFIGGRTRKFETFAPLTLAAIGTLPLPLMHRSVTINMQRYVPSGSEAKLQELDELNPSFPAAREQIQKWASTSSLARNPEMSPELHNRVADTWRVLLAIADDLGHGEAARAAAVALSSGRLDEDPQIVLLMDVRGVFDALGIDRFSSAGLVEALLSLEDGLWQDWRGVRDDRPSRKLNQAELARLLRTFGIAPRTVWPAQRRPGSKSRRGYSRSQFEPVWASYCPPVGTATQAGKIIHLPRS